MDQQYAIRMQYEADALQWLFERSTKFEAQGGRVLAQNIADQNNNHPLLLSKTESHGHMAPSFRRKYLVCFYCNKKSNIRYDGLITRWDCAQCESTNFLDENGDITDPPVATEAAAPSTLKYASTTEESLSSQSYDTNLFCATCQKNQHLYTSSLAQYHVETDPSHPQYRELEREYFAYRKGLERRYPQVCEECEPKVLERMRQAGRTAKADHLRRLMDKSRARKSSKVKGISVSGSIDLVGRCLWYIGLIGQAFWNVVAILLASSRQGLSWVSMASLFNRLNTSPEIMDTITLASIGCSAMAFWWNPMFRQMNNGFMNHISGFRNWYKLQFLSIVVRALLYRTMGTGIFSNPHSPATVGAHIFMAIFISMMAAMSRRSLKVDMSPLWASTPNKFSNVGPKSNSPPEGMESLADVLDEIASTPSKAVVRVSSVAPAPVPAPPISNLKTTPRAPRSALSSSLRPVPPSTLPVQERTGPSLLEMSESESVRYITTGQIPDRLQQQSSGNDIEEMEWTPTQTQSLHRAFNAPRSLQRTTESFGQAPTVDEASPFWYKVPPAPVTPAHKLRNPPNQPTLRVSSREVKENFFNKVTHRNPAVDVALQKSPSLKKDSQRHDILFAQQKFFPPALSNEAGEAGNNLADLLTSFSLGSSEHKAAQKKVESQPRKQHVVQGVMLLLCLLLWNQAVYNAARYSKEAMLVIMMTCIGIGLRGILDNTIFIKGARDYVRQNLAICLYGVEVAGAAYSLREVIAGRGYSENAASLGTILIGGMNISITRRSRGDHQTSPKA